MRFIIQRVSEASVTVEDQTIRKNPERISGIDRSF